MFFGMSGIHVVQLANQSVFNRLVDMGTVYSTQRLSTQICPFSQSMFESHSTLTHSCRTQMCWSPQSEFLRQVTSTHWLSLQTCGSSYESQWLVIRHSLVWSHMFPSTHLEATFPPSAFWQWVFEVHGTSRHLLFWQMLAFSGHPQCVLSLHSFFTHLFASHLHLPSVQSSPPSVNARLSQAREPMHSGA